MTDSDPLVSVVIPTYYRDGTLRRAVESVLDQRYEPVEAIVVDDSGERYAGEIVEDLDVQYVAHESNRGSNSARTTGYRRTSGRYVQFLDDDDRLHDAKIDRQIPLLERSAETGVVYCNLQNRNSLRDPGECAHRGDVLDAALQFDLNPCQTGTMLIDSDVLDGIMPLADRAAADDIGMKIRLAERTQFDYVDDVLFFKGDTGSHRSDTPKFADELEQMITRDFADLYAAAPDAVRRRAQYKLYGYRGSKTLSNTRWSVRAIIAFGAALQYTEYADLTDLATFLLSVFGAPGLALGQATRERVGNRRG